MKKQTHFSRFISNLRRRSNLHMQSLCDGLCTFQEISYLETGRRDPDILLLEELLDRLGIDVEDYEFFIDFRDYERWKKRQLILHSITFGKFDTAQKRLREYREDYCHGEEDSSDFSAKNKLDQQFYLSMLAQIRRCQDCPKSELYSMYFQALYLTVPHYGQKPLQKMALSSKELSLMLEAEYLRPDGERGEIYREIVNYIESRQFSPRKMAKIYPKAVYFLCRCALKTSVSKNHCPFTLTETAKEVRLLEYCNRAIKILKDTKKMYFLWELTKIRYLLLDNLSKTASSTETIGALMEENMLWNHALQEVYNQFEVPAETFHDCYLYAIKNVHCINDVIRIRRNMLQIPPGELCRGICSVKTLKRLEHRESAPQRPIVEALFERLGLSGELTRSKLITADPGAGEHMAQLIELQDTPQTAAAKNLLKKIDQLVSVEIKQNRQTILQEEIFIRWKSKEIDNDEFLEQMRQTLELTLPYEAFLSDGDKFLTSEEQSCIQKRWNALESGSEESITCIHRFEAICRPFPEDELQEMVSGAHEHVMGSIRDHWRNIGDYDTADKYSSLIIQRCLRFRRSGFLETDLHNRRQNHSAFPVPDKLTEQDS